MHNLRLTEPNVGTIKIFVLIIIRLYLKDPSGEQGLVDLKARRRVKSRFSGARSNRLLAR